MASTLANSDVRVTSPDFNDPNAPLLASAGEASGPQISFDDLIPKKQGAPDFSDLVPEKNRDSYKMAVSATSGTIDFSDLVPREKHGGFFTDLLRDVTPHLMDKDIAAATKPLIPIEPFENNPEDGTIKKVAKGIGNTIIGAENFVQSPAGVAAIGAGAIPAARAALAGVFGLQGAKDIGPAVSDAMDAKDAQARTEAISRAGLDSLMIGGGAVGAAKAPPVDVDLADLQASMKSRQGANLVEKPAPAALQGPTEALGAGIPGVPFSKGIDNLVDGIAAAMKASPAKDITAATYDAIGNRAHMEGEQAGNRVRLSVTDKADREALPAVIEAGGDKATMQAHAAQVLKSKKATGKFQRIYRYALANFDRLNPHADAMRQLDTELMAKADAGGVDVDQRQNYVTHAYDQATMPGAGRPIVLSKGKGSGLGRQFKKQRMFETYADAIEAGYIPQNFDIADLWQHHVKQVEGAIGQRAWIDAMRKVENPATGAPIVTDLIRQPKGTFVAPRGYVSMNLFGHHVAVDEFIEPIVRKLSSPSDVPLTLMQIQAKAKHSLLAFDLMHGNRMIARQLAGSKTIGYGRSLAMLKYADRDLAEAVKQGEITQPEADWAKANRESLQALVNNGLNVGRVADALYRDVVKHVPIISHVNELIFGKLSRAAITEVALHKLNQNRASFPELTEQQILRKSAKESNELIGNLGRQGLWKSQTFQDLARLVFLAPQWVEGMARTELRTGKQISDVPVDIIKGKGIRLGTTAKTMGVGLALHFAINQLINMASRGKPTWENEEPGHKLDAYIPDKMEGSTGFWMSPMGLYAELTHDAIRLHRREGNISDTVGDILNNKLAFAGRGAKVMLEGKTFYGKPLPTDMERVVEAGKAMLPTPLIGRSLISKGIDAVPLSDADKTQIRDLLNAREYKGQSERQLISLLGAKIEPVESAQAEIYDAAKAFKREHGIPDVQGEPSKYSSLRQALQQGNFKTARVEYNKLVKAPKDAAAIEQHFVQQAYMNTLAMRSNAEEAQFRQTLDHRQTQVYNEAKRARTEITRRFFQMLNETK